MFDFIMHISIPIVIVKIIQNSKKNVQTFTTKILNPAEKYQYLCSIAQSNVEQIKTMKETK